MLDVSIIIVNWNASALLRKCLEHIQSTVQHSHYEVIVVDNASSDDSLSMVQTSFPTVQLICNSANVGFARANNQGIAQSQGRYLLLLNSDAFVEPGTIDGMVQFMDTHPQAGMAGCQLLNEDRTLQRSAYSFPTLRTELYTALHLDKLLPHSREFGRFLMTYWDFNDVRAVDAIMGAFMLVRRETIDGVGGMDESYFMYSEEIDWCYRINQAGWDILYNPAVQTVHLWGGSSNNIRTESLIRLYRSKVQYFRKHYGIYSARLLKLIIGMGCVLRIGPGRLYYRTPNQLEKYRSFQQLLRAVPGF